MTFLFELYYNLCFFADTILDIRLLDENENVVTKGLEGKLEMLYKGQWLPLCYGSAMENDYIWNNQAAWVACKQRGFYGGRSIMYDGLSVNTDLKVMDFRCDDGTLHMYIHVFVL